MFLKASDNSGFQNSVFKKPLNQLVGFFVVDVVFFIYGFFKIIFHYLFKFYRLWKFKVNEIIRKN